MRNKKSWKWLIPYSLGGNILKEDFVIKQSKLIFLIFCLIIIFISNRYYCSKQLTEMDRLKRELAILNYEHVRLTSQLTKISLQSQIEESLKEKGIGLRKNNSTVYQINK